MTMVDNSMISFERGGKSFERFLDDDGRQFDDFLRTWRRRFQEIPWWRWSRIGWFPSNVEEKISRDSSITVVENSMISFEREGSRVLSFERFLDDDDREFDDFLRTWRRRFQEIPWWRWSRIGWFPSNVEEKISRDSSMTMVENSMISFEHRSRVLSLSLSLSLSVLSLSLNFERFFDNDGRQFDDFLRIWMRRD